MFENLRTCFTRRNWRIYSTVICLFSSCSTVHAFETPAQYLKSYLGEKPPLSHVYSMDSGQLLKKTDNISVAFINPPSKDVRNFALWRILEFAEAVGSHVQFEPPQSGRVTVNELVVFDKFFSDDGTLDQSYLNKYGISTNIKLQNADLKNKCFSYRTINNSTIAQTVDVIDSSLSGIDLEYCLNDTISSSFGLDIEDIWKENLEHEDLYNRFVESYGALLLRKRDTCFLMDSLFLNYKCLSEK
jgi:hypothetical protein